MGTRAEQPTLHDTPLFSTSFTTDRLPDQFCHLQFSLADDDTLCGAPWAWADHSAACRVVGITCHCGKTMCPLCEILYKES